ncbi:MAG TPA: VTT domain-containing protein [Anaerolineae bacterium]|nr:VTT domain-containing protein [Anaerolineae bacterium]
MPDPPPAASSPPAFFTGRAFRLLVLALVIGISVGIYAFRDQFTRLAAIGYPGIFVVSLLGNATIILPAPSLALVFAMGSALPPLFVGLAAGAGEALGELTGYAAGFGGRAIVEDRVRFERIRDRMKGHVGITILVLSLIPNPFFDLAGIAAGTLRYPIHRFLFFCWLGKTIKTITIAWMGSQSIHILDPLLY